MAIESTPTNHRVRQLHQRLVDVVTLFVSHPQSAKSLLPTQRALDHPAEAAQTRTAVDATSRDPRHDASLPQSATQGLVIIRFVGVQLLGALSWPPALATHWLNRVHRRKHLLAIRHVRPRQRDSQRQATAVYQLMAFRARFAAIRGVRPCRAPFL
jgi:hypothetical protein